MKGSSRNALTGVGFGARLRILLATVAAASASLLAGCGGGSGTMPGSPLAAAERAGEAACAGKSPLAVKDAYYDYAVEEGTLEPSSERGRMIGDLDALAARAGADPSFIVGQLAADTYAATLPGTEAKPGYRGCFAALSRGRETGGGGRR